MNERLEHILELELVNTNSIHLFFFPFAEEWVAYEQSAVNLCTLMPELYKTLTEEVFVESEIKLRCVSIGRWQSDKYRLYFLGTLLVKNYVEISLEVPAYENSLSLVNS